MILLLLACADPVGMGFPEPGAARFAELDVDGSGRLERRELDGGDRTLLDDEDGDGALDVDEFRQHMKTATSGSVGHPEQGPKPPPPGGRPRPPQGRR